MYVLIFLKVERWINSFLLTLLVIESHFLIQKGRNIRISVRECEGYVVRMMWTGVLRMEDVRIMFRGK